MWRKLVTGRLRPAPGALARATRACFLCGFPSGLLIGSLLLAQDRVAISEIMYHPVGEAAFATNGEPLLDLSHDVHEHIELHNYEDAPVSLAGWSLKGGIEYAFPAGTILKTGGYLVAAKNPERLLAVAAYSLPAASVFGPWQGQLNIASRAQAGGHRALHGPSQ